VAFETRFSRNRSHRQHSAAGATDKRVAGQCADVQPGVQNPVGGDRRRGDDRELDRKSGYVEQDDGLGGYLDVDDSDAANNAGLSFKSF
jgi:hypothetical protein